MIYAHFACVCNSILTIYAANECTCRPIDPPRHGNRDESTLTLSRRERVYGDSVGTPCGTSVNSANVSISTHWAEDPSYKMLSILPRKGEQRLLI
jgi:hypothetical protein